MILSLEDKNGNTTGCLGLLDTGSTYDLISKDIVGTY